MTMERKSFAPHDFKLSETGEVEAAFAQMNVVDFGKDVSLPGSFPAGKAVPMSAYGHTSWDGVLPIGKGSISEQGDWAVFSGGFFMDTEQGRNGYNTVKAMADLQEWSYGLNPFDTEMGQKDGQRVRFIKGQDVLEVSPVLKGEGIATHTLAIKSGRPESGRPYAEQILWYSEGLPALIDRFKGHAAARLAEGRKLSRSDRAALEELVETLDGQLATARELLVVPEDPAKAVDPVTLDILLSTARRLGVPA